MAKFVVTLEETVRYYVDVEADDEDEAGEVAREIWAESENPDEDFNAEGQGVEVWLTLPSS